ncbi:hypothetical protein [Gracilibacillus salinarum]|uniref:Uncharacterized protein n=1 Tax=Gracilibacillus salinarum TaxID=2932255 RepID=A0ABY4GMV1_9BACI|nr:hypothetical protein [Gracilibacillus salinarum]UOQ85705.1 hypothetical protein MUN87_02015 [Gracilibacillus salinarum]
MSEVAVDYKERFTVENDGKLQTIHPRRLHKNKKRSSKIKRISPSAMSEMITSKVEYIEIINEFDFSDGIGSKKAEKGNINNVREHKVSKKPYSKVVATMFLSQPFFKESTLLAKEQIENDMFKDIKHLSFWAIIGNIVTAVFSIPFWIIVILLIFLALTECIYSIGKRFRLPGIDYSPISKAIVLISLLGLFLVVSVVQIGMNYFLALGQGMPITQLAEESPKYAQLFLQFANLQTLLGFILISFYINSIRKMVMYGTGLKTSEWDEKAMKQHPENL